MLEVGGGLVGGRLPFCVSAPRDVPKDMALQRYLVRKCQAGEMEGSLE